MRLQKAWEEARIGVRPHGLSRLISESIGLRIRVLLCRFVPALLTILIIRSRRLITRVVRMIVVMCRCTLALVHVFCPNLKSRRRTCHPTTRRFWFYVDFIFRQQHSAGRRKVSIPWLEPVPKPTHRLHSNCPVQRIPLRKPDISSGAVWPLLPWRVLPTTSIHVSYLTPSCDSFQCRIGHVRNIWRWTVRAKVPCFRTAPFHARRS
jgi:hypothetical protein